MWIVTPGSLFLMYIYGEASPFVRVSDTRLTLFVRSYVRSVCGQIVQDRVLHTTNSVCFGKYRNVYIYMYIYAHRNTATFEEHQETKSRNGAGVSVSPKSTYQQLPLMIMNNNESGGQLTCRLRSLYACRDSQQVDHVLHLNRKAVQNRETSGTYCRCSRSQRSGTDKRTWAANRA